MRIFFIGTVEFSKKALEKLIEIDSNIVGVATKSESSFNADYVELAPVCQKHNIECRTVNNINSAEVLSWIKSLEPDIIFCFGWSYLLKKGLLNLAPMGVIGYHPSELPMNRGRHPIIWALTLGLKKTASSFFFMEEGADDGDILSQEKVVILDEDDAGVLYNRLIGVALKQIKDFHEKLLNSTYDRIKQDHSKANNWRKRGRKDGEIDFRMSSQSIYNLIRGLTKPYIGAHIIHNNKEIKVWSSKLGSCVQKNLEPGKVLDNYQNMIEVKTGDGSILLIKHDFEECPKIGKYL